MALGSGWGGSEDQGAFDIRTATVRPPAPQGPRAKRRLVGTAAGTAVAGVAGEAPGVPGGDGVEGWAEGGAWAIHGPGRRLFRGRPFTLLQAGSLGLRSGEGGGREAAVHEAKPEASRRAPTAAALGAAGLAITGTASGSARPSSGGSSVTGTASGSARRSSGGRTRSRYAWNTAPLVGRRPPRCPWHP